MRSDPRVGAISPAVALSVCGSVGPSSQALATRRAWALGPAHRSRADPRTGHSRSPKISHRTAPGLVLVHRWRRTGCSTKYRSELGLLTISMTQSRLLGRRGIRHGTGWACTFLLMFICPLGVANAEPSLHHAPASREGQPLTYREPFCSGMRKAVDRTPRAYLPN